MNENENVFTQLADKYDDFRPTTPLYPTEVITSYLGKKPDTVVDLGCGTGLSTVIWQGLSNNIIGIEPNQKMIEIAKSKKLPNTEFIQSLSHNIPINSNSIDCVVAFNSFHWMEPKKTLEEINRILKSGGVFATVDSDKPPVSIWQAEEASVALLNEIRKIKRNNIGIIYDKNKHLQNMIDSGYFRYCREIVFMNKENCTKQRYIDLTLNCGSMQEYMKGNVGALQENVEKFISTINSVFKEDNFQISFCYRMRIGIK